MATSAPGAPAAPAPGLSGLSRKVKKILEIKAEAPDLINALATLSTFYTENTPTARRALRSTVEKRGLEINGVFLDAAEAVIQALDTAQQNLDGLSSSCSRVAQVLSSTKDMTSRLLAETERLQREQEAVERKAYLVTEFLDNYQLTPEETAALQSEEIGPPFFNALARVRAIHDNCRALLRTSHQRAGLELMDMMATYQEAAYERLCRWVQGECRNIGEFDAPEVDSILQSAVRALHERPVLFKYCAEEVATARHNALFQRFITALTRGGPGGMPRPIEIHAHDPQRYINDMLAWVHQALAGEREFVVALFGDDQPPANGGPAADGTRPRSLSNGPASDGGARGSGAGALHEADEAGGLGSDGVGTAAVLDRIFESICRPLRVRIEQVLMTTPPLLLCFQLAQLHAFYLGLITRIIGPGAQLVQTLAACRDMSHRVFMEQIRGRSDKLLRHPPPPPKDLTPPPQVLEAVHGMLEVVNAYESAMETAAAQQAGQRGGAGAPGTTTSTSNSGASTVEDIGPVLSAILEPLVEACERSAEALAPDAPSRVDEAGLGGQTRVDPSARHIYLINCLSSAATALTHHPCAGQRAAALSDAIEGHVSALVGLEAGRILARCGLADIVGRLRVYRSHLGASNGSRGPGEQEIGTDGSEGAKGAQGGLPASDPALSHTRVVEVLRQFFIQISSPDALPEFPAIQAPRLRADAVARVAQALAEAFESVYNALDDPTMGYTEGSSAVRNTPAQVRTILGVL